MNEYLPAYLIREQAAVGALAIFGVSRVIAAAVALSKGWRIAVVEQCFIGVAALYCLLPLFEAASQFYSWHDVGADCEGKAIGCAVALFFSPILSHRLGFE